MTATTISDVSKSKNLQENLTGIETFECFGSEVGVWEVNWSMRNTSLTRWASRTHALSKCILPPMDRTKSHTLRSQLQEQNGRTCVTGYWNKGSADQITSWRFSMTICISLPISASWHRCPRKAGPGQCLGLFMCLWIQGHQGMVVQKGEFA